MKVSIAGAANVPFSDLIISRSLSDSALNILRAQFIDPKELLTSTLSP